MKHGRGRERRPENGRHRVAGGRRRCLFVMEDHPITPNAPGGGPVLMSNHLELLARAGVELHLVVLTDPERSFGFRDYVERQPERWAEVRSWCASHRVLTLSRVVRKSSPAKHLLLALRDPAAYLFTTVNAETTAAFGRTVAELAPDLIWAENLVPALLAAGAAGPVPVVYSHHDWIWRIFKLQSAGRGRACRSRMNIRLTKRAEHSLIRRVAGCVSASVTEYEELQRLKPRRAHYLPTTYAAADLPGAEAPRRQARVVHLGGMQTAASRIGLQRFLELVWPVVRAQLNPAPELWVVGSLKGAPNRLLDALKQAGAVCTGFVADLGSVLSPFDLHVVPWEHNTGTRTRIPAALNYSQLVISTKSAAACLPELKHGENCVLVDELRSMAGEIVSLATDIERRVRIAASGRRTFMECYTVESALPRVNRILDHFRAAATGADGGAGSSAALTLGLSLAMGL